MSNVINVCAAGTDCKVFFDESERNVTVTRHFNSDQDLVLILNAQLEPTALITEARHGSEMQLWDLPQSGDDSLHQHAAPMFLAVDYALSHPNAKPVHWIGSEVQGEFAEKYATLYDPYVISEHALRLGPREYAKVLVADEANHAVVKIRDEANQRTLVLLFT